jgi:hypothetical protein
MDMSRFDTKELTHIVQARRKYGDFDVGWHSIAAFDSEIVAIRYERDCADLNGHRIEYRIVERQP